MEPTDLISDEDVHPALRWFAASALGPSHRIQRAAPPQGPRDVRGALQRGLATSCARVGRTERANWPRQPALG